MDALTISILANIMLGFVLLGVLYHKREGVSERLTGPEQALACYRTRFPTASGRVSLAADGQAALLELADGTLGLVARCGRRWNVRALEPKEIVGVDRGGDGAITLRFADLGWPRARVQLSDPGTCDRLIERLVTMRGADHAGREQRVRRA